MQTDKVQTYDKMPQTLIDVNILRQYPIVVTAAEGYLKDEKTQYRGDICLNGHKLTYKDKTWHRDDGEVYQIGDVIYCEGLTKDKVLHLASQPVSWITK